MDTTLAKKLSTLVQSQLPDFVKENYPTFQAFLEAYYEYLEQDGEAQYVIQNARDYADIDATIDSFVDKYLNQFINDLPTSIFKNQETGLPFTNDEYESKKAFAKHASQFYGNKGSEAAIRLLFRLIFNDEINIYYPKDDLLKVSDGKWGYNTTIKVIPTSNVSLLGLTANIITGQASNAFAVVDSIAFLGQEFPGLNVYELKLEKENTLGTFTGNETIRFGYYDVDTGNLVVTGNATVLNVISNVSIISPGYGYTVGSTVSLVGDGASFSARVSAVNDGGKIQDIQIVNFGANYSRITTNRIRNSIGVGAVAGTPGTFPNNWTTVYATGGLTRQIVGTGTESGIPYIDIRYFGTTTNVLGQTISFESVSGNVRSVGCNVGDTWTTSVYLALVGGTTANVQNLNVIEWEVSGGGSLLTNSETNVLANLTPTLSRFSSTKTVVAGSFIFPGLLIRPTGTSVTIDYTLRVGLPQLELGSSPTTAIPTSNSAVKVSIAQPSTTKTGRYELSGNIVTGILYDSTGNAINHGLVANDLINVSFTSGLTSAQNGLYNIQNIFSSKKFRFYLGNTLTVSGNITLNPIQANVDATIGTLCVYDATYDGTDGQPDSVKKIQDSYLWQDYSYVIRSTQSSQYWKDIIKQALHPAGMELFAEVFISTASEVQSVDVKPSPGLYETIVYLLKLLIADEVPSTRVVNVYPNTVVEVYNRAARDLGRYVIGPTWATIDDFKFGYTNLRIYDLANITLDYLGTLINEPSPFPPPSEVQKTGANIIANSSFASSGANWSAGTGWTINTGSAVATAATSNANTTTTATLLNNTVYVLQYDIPTLTSGTIRAVLNSGTFSNTTATRSAVGTYTEYIFVSSSGALTAGNLIFNPATAFTGSLDNVYLYPLSVVTG